jgi:lysophospholipase L1-like esterase
MSYEPAQRGCRSKVLSRLGLTTFSLLVCFVLLELFARLIFQRQQHQAEQSTAAQLYRPDEVLEWTHVPDQRTLVQVEGREVVLEINSHGLRDREYSYEKPPNTFRILVLGDSFTEAAQVNLEDAFHSIVEQRLNQENEPGLRFEVISAGVAGYGVTRSMVYYEEVGYRYDADLVLLAFYMGNDMQDDYQPLAQERPFPGIYREQFFRLTGEGELEPLVVEVESTLAPGAAQAQARSQSRVSRIDAWLFGHLRFYYYVRPFLSEQVPFIRRALFALGFVESPAPVLPRYADVDAATFEAAWALEDALIARLSADAGQHGAGFAVIMIPDYVQIYPDALENDYPLFYPAMLDDMDLGQTDRALLSILDRQGIAYLRLYPVFQQARESGGAELYSASARHWNQAGHRLAADAIYEWLLDEGLVAPGQD